MSTKYTTTRTILYLDNVELGYGSGQDYKCILKDITMLEKDIVREGVLATGQTIAVIGRSGRGKSTLFKALTGLVKPVRGNVLITDTGKADDSAKIVREGDVGFVDQKYTLFRHKTVYQILMSALRNSKLSKEEKEDKINKYLEEWGLVEHKTKYPCELSGGQRQRTAIIEQIFSSGHFMILDEPFSGLDVGNIKNVKRAFKMVQDHHELNTIVFSTHDLKLAVELADSIYVVGHKEGYNDCSTIVAHYDLKEMGLAWEDFGPKHLEFLNQLTELVEKS